MSPKIIAPDPIPVEPTRQPPSGYCCFFPPALVRNCSFPARVCRALGVRRAVLAMDAVGSPRSSSQHSGLSDCGSRRTSALPSGTREAPAMPPSSPICTVQARGPSVWARERTAPLKRERPRRRWRRRRPRRTHPGAIPPSATPSGHRDPAPSDGRGCAGRPWRTSPSMIPFEHDSLRRTEVARCVSLCPTRHPAHSVRLRYARPLPCVCGERGRGRKDTLNDMWVPSVIDC